MVDQREKKLIKVFDAAISFSDRYREYKSTLILRKTDGRPCFDIIRQTVSISIASDSPKERTEKSDLFLWDALSKRYKMSIR